MNYRINVTAIVDSNNANEAVTKALSALSGLRSVKITNVSNAISLKLRNSKLPTYLQEDTMREVENLINDGRAVNEDATTIYALFDFASQPEGAVFWELANGLFTIK